MQLALGQFTQQGTKLVGTGAIGDAQQGTSVALSGDGNTAIVGGPNDNSNTSNNSGAGAAWLFTQSNGTWSLEGVKLVGTGAVGNAQQGVSVAVSTDGNTAIVGGPNDNSSTGAAWVFIRNASGVWIQQGSKLVGIGATGSAQQGISVALSGDGNTAIVGGPGDNSHAGAAWVFTRSGGVWTQQGSKLVGTGGVAAAQGWSVALSDDGNTAVVGGPGDNSHAGATWVFTRSGGVWSQQGNKLVGTGAVGSAVQGFSVALSDDGNTAIVGGYGDSANAGAAWLFIRGGGVWTQQGSKLVGTGAVGAAFQGSSVSLSGDGNTAIVGGPNDNSSAGAAWVFIRNASGVWIQQGSKLVGTGATGSAQQGISVALSGDGNTSIVGGPGDNSNAGTAWVFVQPTSTQSPSTQTQTATTASTSSGLVVTPSTNIVASGPQGGPFSPLTFNYTLTASRSGTAYSITNVPNWLTASSTSGNATKSGTTITFTINSSANSLEPGTYIGNINFNQTSLTATLTVNPAQYTVAVSASPSADGTVSGGGTFAAGSSVTVTATANSGFNFVNWTTSVPGTSNGVLFNGSSQNTLVPTSFGLAGASKSFSVWFRTSGTSEILIAQSDTAINPPGVNSTSWVPAVYVGTDGKLYGAMWTGGFATVTSAGTVNDGNWHHAVFTSSSTGALTLYLDGGVAASGSFAAPTEAWWTDTWFADGQGSSWPALNSGDQWLNGALCDVRIYNRVITGAEVSTLFSGGNVSSGLVGEYFASTATSASANDQSGGGNNGSFNGSPTLTTGPSALSGNGSVVSTSPSYTFTLNSNVALVANFTPVQDTVAVSASPNAGGTVSGGGTFAAGSSDTVTATANNGYQFVNWTQNGSQVSTSASYTFTVNSNVTLVANFTTVATQYTVAVSASPSADGTVSGGGTFAAGSSVTVTATANSGFNFVNWTQNGSQVSTAASYTFTVNSNVALVADFTPVAASGIVPTANNVVANWTMAGMQSVGGIPNRTAVCATVSPIGGGASDTANINSAIASCPAGEVVMLSAGTFSLYSSDSPEGIQLNKGVTLRGTGTCNNASTPYCQTVIVMADGTIPFGSTCGNQNACNNNTAFGVIVGIPGYYYWSRCSYASSSCPGATPVDADAAQGATTIQVHSTSNFSVGMWVLIDEASGASYQSDPIWGGAWATPGTKVWAAADAFDNTSTPATGRVVWMKHNPTISGDDFSSSTYPYTVGSTGCYYSFCDRPTSEIHLITAIGSGPCPGANCTLTFDSPLTIAYRQSGSHNAQVYYPTANSLSSYTPFVQNAGVENMTIERTDGGGVKFQYCAYCWAKNVEVYHWRDDAVGVSYSARVQIDSVYSHECTDSENSGVEYPFDLMFASTEVYIVNSITQTCGKGMTIRSAGAGSVVAYNWIDQMLYHHAYSGGDAWIETALDASHAAGSHETLFEGNMAPNMDVDDTHGNVVYHTYFRNWATGFRYGSFVDPSFTSVTINDTTNTPGGNAPYRAAGPTGYDYWFAYIGNVMGTAGLSTAANGWSYQNGTYGGAAAKPIWMAGWNNLAPYPNHGDPNLNGTGTLYIFRHGNYDYVTPGLVWDPNTSNHTLPNSLYRSSAPAFFSAGASCTYPWPWVTPTGSPQIQTNSCAGSGLPALARFNAGTPFVQP